MGPGETADPRGPCAADVVHSARSPWDGGILPAPWTPHAPPSCLPSASLNTPTRPLGPLTAIPGPSISQHSAASPAHASQPPSPARAHEPEPLTELHHVPQEAVRSLTHEEARQGSGRRRGTPLASRSRPWPSSAHHLHPPCVQRQAVPQRDVQGGGGGAARAVQPAQRKALVVEKVGVRACGVRDTGAKCSPAAEKVALRLETTAAFLAAASGPVTYAYPLRLHRPFSVGPARHSCHCIPAHVPCPIRCPSSPS